MSNSTMQFHIQLNEDELKMVLGSLEVSYAMLETLVEENPSATESAVLLSNANDLIQSIQAQVGLN